jgi:DNA-binding IclR family transcriptional regulator
VVCVGAPVNSLKSQGVAAIGIVAPSYRFPQEKMDRAAVLVKETADKISSAMGCNFSGATK